MRVAHALRSRTTRDDDSGMSLVELLVYSLLLSVVLILVGNVLISALTVQRDTTARTEASTGGQVAVRVIERALRNGVDPVWMPSSQAGNLLVVKTRIADDGSAASSWECRAFHYDAAAEELRMLTGPATGPLVTIGPSGTLDSSSWRVLLSGVVPTPNGASAEPVFETEPLGGAKINFDVKTQSGAVSFATTVIPREQGSPSEIGGVSCT